MSRERSFWMSTEFIWNKYTIEHVGGAGTSENAYAARNIYSYFTSYRKPSLYISFFSWTVRSSQENYESSAYESKWVSEQHSRFTTCKVKQLHSISSLKENIFIHSFFFSFPLLCFLICCATSMESGPLPCHFLILWIKPERFFKLPSSAFSFISLFKRIWKKCPWESLRNMFIIVHCRRHCKWGHNSFMEILAEVSHASWLQTSVCFSMHDCCRTWGHTATFLCAAFDNTTSPYCL